jgi:phosphoglucosamine mutase
MIFLDHNTTGDGMLSALQVLAIMRRNNKSLSALAEVMIPLPQVLVNVRVAERTDIMTIPDVAALVRDVEGKLNDSGRILIRYSGTEPLLRIMLEGPDTYQINSWAKEIAELVEKKIGGK